MGRGGGKNKKKTGGKSGDSKMKQSSAIDNISNSKAYDTDTVVFISMSQELKEEGNRLFQRKDYEGAMLKYEKALKLLPGNHIDVSYLRSNMAECYMQLGLSEYPRAIHECNLALEVTPKYSKALLKRARCYEALNRLDLALRDVNAVLKMEPNNLMAAEIAERVSEMIGSNGRENDIPIDLVQIPEYFEPPPSPAAKLARQKTRKKKTENLEQIKVVDKMEEQKADDRNDEKKSEDRKDKKKAEDKKDEKKAEVINDKKQGGDREDEKKAEHKNDEKKEGKENEEKKDENENDKKKAGSRNDEKKGGNKNDKKKAGKRNDEKKVGNKNDEKEAETKNGEQIAQENIKEREAGGPSKPNKSRDQIQEKKAEDKLVVEEETITKNEEEPQRAVKLVYGEDIRWAQIPLNCSVLKLREIISDRFPSSKAVLIKYRDHEGDLVTITTTEELRWAEAAAERNSIRLYIIDVNPDQDLLLGKIKKEEAIEQYEFKKQEPPVDNGNAGKSTEIMQTTACISDWVIEFAEIFKNYVGLDTDSYLDLHQVGMKLCSEAMEETVTSEDAQDLFSAAAVKFQEMAALALFNWGNVHMSRARKKVYSPDESSNSVLDKVKAAYEWAQEEYVNAGKKYEEALKIKPDFYEAVLALGQQQFEQAKLSWYYAVANEEDLESWNSSEVLYLYNSAEENVEKGIEMWEEAEDQRLSDILKPSRIKTLLQSMKLDELVKDMSIDEVTEQAANIRSQLYVLWGTILYERSVMEFKIGLPVWHECLEVSIEKFEQAGASPTDIAVMIKNHCSNDTALDGLGFNIDEIVQAWNEMYEAKKWEKSIPSFRLEPLLRRRASKIYYALEHA